MTWKRCADCGQPTAPNRVRCPRCLALVFGLELPNPGDCCRLHGGSPEPGCWTCSQNTTNDHRNRRLT
jgi:hypothetical protein